MEDKNAKRRGSLGWILQAGSGVFLLALLGLHMIMQHYVVEGGMRDYNEVIEYMAKPALMLLEVLFLIFVTYHALVGLRSIIFDLGLKEKTQKIVTNVLWVIGVATVIYGIWLALHLFNGGVL